MRIALLGTRGVPASYSGFETCVEQLGSRLVERGHEVFVYCRRHHVKYVGEQYKGMSLIFPPTVQNKYLDTIVHTTLSSIHALTGRYDIALYFIAGNSPTTWIPRMVGTSTVLNVDGLDWKRAKWPGFAIRYLKLAEYLATRLPTAYITDSRAVQASYEARFGSTPLYIPYGSEVEMKPPAEVLERYKLVQGEYVLFVGRLVPENNVDHLIEAYRHLDTQKKCVIVGDSTYAEDYKERLHQLAEGDQRIVFTGYQFGDAYHELGSNALIFVETSAVGGTHPAVVEAMAFGNCVIVNGTPENVETIGDAGLSYDPEQGAKDLASVLGELLTAPDKIAALGERAEHRAAEKYSWEAVTDQYEELFHRLREGS